MLKFNITEKWKMPYKVHRATFEVFLNLIKLGSPGYRKYTMTKECVNQHLGTESDEVRMWDF